MKKFNYCVYRNICDDCEMCLKDKRNILYKFIGCGKYHNIKLCNLCFHKKFGYTPEKEIHFKTDRNPDPLGMKIIIYKRLK